MKCTISSNNIKNLAVFQQENSYTGCVCFSLYLVNLEVFTKTKFLPNTQNSIFNISFLIFLE